MDSCTHEEVNNKDDLKESSTSILRQLAISSSLWTQFFMAGLCIGAPTVLVPQMRKEANSTEIISNELNSWLYTTPALSVYPWIIILPIFTERVGRKIPQIIVSFNSIIIFTSLYLSQTPYHVLLSEMLQGYLHAGNVSVTILIITEYTSPKYRGLFLTVKSASFFWGLCIANGIGTFFHWKYIALLGILCSIYTLNVFFWPESPFWLASKGRYEECRQSHKWLHGSKLQNVLRQLLSDKETLGTNNTGFLRNLNNPLLYKPLIISFVAIMQYNFSGKIICSLYILDIFHKITGNTDSSYRAMLILDCVTVVGMYFGTYLSKILKRRTLYISSSFTGVAFLLIISLYLFLIRLNYLIEYKYLTLGLLIVYSISISCGPMIMSMSVYGEIVPAKFQTCSYIFILFTYTTFYTVLVKFTPALFSFFKLDGTFFLYGVICGLCTIYLYVFLPETKNKTQWEIEECFKNKSDINEEHEMLER